MVDHAAEQHRPPALQAGVRVEVGEDPVVLAEDLEVPLAGGVQDASGAPLPVVHAHPVEGGDRPRRHQHRVRPRGVLVVAGREGEALPLDELPPVRLVPGHREQAEQPGPVGEGERRRAVLGEPVGDLVAHGLAGPVGAGVVVDQDVGVAGLLQPVGDGEQRVRGEGVVAVQEHQVVAGRAGHARVAGRAQADVGRQMHRPHPRVLGRELVDHSSAGVGRAVVHGDQFEIRVRLGQHRLQALAQIRLNLVRGDNDTEPGQGASNGRCGRSARQRPLARLGYATVRHPGNRVARRGGPRPVRPQPHV